MIVNLFIEVYRLPLNVWSCTFCGAVRCLGLHSYSLLCNLNGDKFVSNGAKSGVYIFYEVTEVFETNDGMLKRI